MHPDRRQTASEFKKRLVEKQRLRYSYWLSEEQLRRYVRRAFTRRGQTGDELVGMLERRLDNLVCRLGFAPTLLSARQLVVHGHIRVDNAKVDKPSYLLKPGEVISVKDQSKSIDPVQLGLARGASRALPPYLEVDKDNLRGKLLALPAEPMFHFRWKTVWWWSITRSTSDRREPGPPLNPMALKAGPSHAPGSRCGAAACSVRAFGSP